MRPKKGRRKAIKRPKAKKAKTSKKKVDGRHGTSIKSAFECRNQSKHFGQAMTKHQRPKKAKKAKKGQKLRTFGIWHINSGCILGIIFHYKKTSV